MPYLSPKHLDFDVPGIFDEFLDEDAAIAEARLRLRRRGKEPFPNLFRRPGDAHALAAAACACLDHHRVADVACDANRLVRALDHAEIAGHGRDARGRGGLLALDLVAHRADRFDVRTNECDAVRLQRLGEGRVLRQKAITRMDRFRACLLGRLDDLIHDEIGLGGGRRPDQNGLVRHLDMDSVTIRFGIDGHRLDAHPLRGLYHTACDFAAVGNKDFLEHGRPPLRRRQEIAPFALF